MPIGPQLPPTAEKRKRSDADEREDSDDSDDSVGPLPPSNNVEDSKVKKARVAGPSLPPPSNANDKKMNATADSKGEESSDDDDFGPSLPPPAGSKSDPPADSQTKAHTKPATALTAPTKVQRDEWMTMAPTSGDWSQRIDPTKLKNRKFNTGRSNNTSSSGSDIWNETPEQKQARLRREVLGIKNQKSQQHDLSSTASEDTETARRMKEYNSQRGPSLYEAHQKGKTIEEDDPSARAFDREKDIAGGLQINATQRREMMKKSSDFNSRFSSAKYL